MAATRLALLDLDARSNQPFRDDSGRFILAYNGELYNYTSIRRSLEAEGVLFRTNSDTEVLLQLIIERGAETAIDLLEGMFSFALCDLETGLCVLARDHFGIKPLWEFEDSEKLLYASECKAFKPWVDLEADLFSVSAYLTDVSVPTQNHTFYHNVSIVPPGSLIRVPRRGRPERQSYFQIEQLYNQELSHHYAAMGGSDLIDRAEELLVDAIRRQAYADASVGALCSGGLDSALIATLAARVGNNLTLFHANVVGKASELDAAEKVAHSLGKDLVTVTVTDRDFLEYLSKVIHHYEHPVSYHPSSIPFYRVSNLVRNHGVKGVLSGEGADECFLGYPSIPVQRWTRPVRRSLSSLNRWIAAIPRIGKYLALSGSELEHPKATLLGRSETSIEHTRIEDHIHNASPATLDTIKLLTYHLRSLLHRNDSLGMAASIEARFPFLDRALVEFAVNLPRSAKLRYNPTSFHLGHPFVIDKWIVRRVADRYLPQTISRRKKRGFPTDTFERFTIEHDFFSDSFIRDLLKLSDAQLAHILEQSTKPEIRRLMELEVWLQVCLHDEQPSEATMKLKKYVKIE